MLKIIGSADPKYLAASDLLIGDMSNINYEFLLFDRPIVLLANEWIKQNIPDIGIKANLKELKSAIECTIASPEKYKNNRDYWLTNTISITEKSASRRYLEIILNKSGYINPLFIFIHGNNPVRKTNLSILKKEINRLGFSTKEVSFVRKQQCIKGDVIFIAAHVADLNIKSGFKVHIEHGLKGKGTGDIDDAIQYYKSNSYFPLIDLHITTGIIGDEWTKIILGPASYKTVIGGYPKGDLLLNYNNEKSKKEVYAELGFDIKKPLITYASAGKLSFPKKPGGSMSPRVINELKNISDALDINILVKYKYSKYSYIKRGLNIFNRVLYKF